MDLHAGFSAWGRKHNLVQSCERIWKPLFMSSIHVEVTVVNVAPYLLRHFSACTDINQTRLYCCFLQRQTLRVYWNTAELYNQILSGWSFCFVSSEQLFTILTQNCCAASKEGLLWVVVQEVQKRWLGNVPVLCRTEMFAAAEQKQRSGTRFVC